MICPLYRGLTCGLECCLAKAEQFACYQLNQPSFSRYCPLSSRYGALMANGGSKDDQPVMIRSGRVTR